MQHLTNNQIFYAACGGLTLGLACSLNTIIRGKETGMTRIAYNIITLNKKQLPQMLSILGGIWLISSIFYLIYGNGKYNGFQPYGPNNQITIETSKLGFIISGFLVGFGAKLGGGCTSGHGLSGLSRLSIRSFIGVCMFMLGGIGIRMYGLYYGLGVLEDKQFIITKSSVDHNISAKIFLGLALILPILGHFINVKYNKKSTLGDNLLIYIIGGIFATGLLISGMSRRVNVIHFLQMDKNWNPSLLFVLGCGVGLHLITYTIMKKKGTSLNGNKISENQKDKIIDWRVFVGGLCFGLGWGIGGLCPGPFYVLFAVFTVQIQILWGLGFGIGAILGGKLQKKQASKIQKIKQAIGIKTD